jgi:trimethylamine--corrinoid protein Co-methyltransferase
MNDGQTGRRSGGRADRVAKRALPPAVNPCPPGQRGGQYRPLSEADMQAIYRTALRLLSDLGVGEVPEIMVKPFVAAGATFGDGRVFFPRDLVERVIGLAAKTFTFHGRSRSAAMQSISAPGVLRS